MIDKGNDKKLGEEIDRIARPVFGRFLHETLPNSMTITPDTQKRLWRPHNYRRQIVCKNPGNSGLKKIISTIDTTTRKQNIKYSDHTKLFFWKQYQPNITLQLGSRTLTAIYSQTIEAGYKKTWLIEFSTIGEYKRFIETKKQEIQDKLDDALIKFTRKYNLLIPMNKPVWKRAENWERGDEFIEKLPVDMIIHARTFKKVYEKGIEHTTTDTDPTEYITSFIENRQIEKWTPEIAKELNRIHNSIQSMQKPKEPERRGINWFKEHIKNLSDCHKYAEDIRHLPTQENWDLGEWIFKTYMM